ncbi:hypothetical protein BJ912DRAFT_1063990 [Pholiota molesta]|nr:hypothetical protein BJ912DRAFT_1063990 [Pholiota molesta]
MSDRGLLFVYGEVGPDVSEDEFNDWYDNEHGPARLTVPGFNTAVRYKATDGLTPTWLALYDLTTSSVASDKPYQTLVANATPRDRDIIPRTGRLNRRIYDLINVVTKPDLPPSALPGKFLLLVSWLIGSEADEDFNKWYDEEHVPALAKVPGFQRARRYKLVDSVEIGRKPDPATVKPTHNYLTLYDVDSDDYNKHPDFVATSQTPWTGKVFKATQHFEIRRFALHKNLQPPQ